MFGKLASISMVASELSRADSIAGSYNSGRVVLVSLWESLPAQPKYVEPHTCRNAILDLVSARTQHRDLRHL